MSQCTSAGRCISRDAPLWSVDLKLISPSTHVNTRVPMLAFPHTHEANTQKADICRNQFAHKMQSTHAHTETLILYKYSTQIERKSLGEHIHNVRALTDEITHSTQDMHNLKLRIATHPPHTHTQWTRTQRTYSQDLDFLPLD